MLQSIHPGYSVASTYRYSFAYWGTYILNRISGGSNSSENSVSPNLFGISLHWKGFGKADASGAVAGAIGGAIADPTAPWVGAALGAIGGSLGASVAHLFFNVGSAV